MAKHSVCAKKLELSGRMRSTVCLNKEEWLQGLFRLPQKICTSKDLSKDLSCTSEGAGWRSIFGWQTLCQRCGAAEEGTSRSVRQLRACQLLCQNQPSWLGMGCDNHTHLEHTPFSWTFHKIFQQYLLLHLRNGWSIHACLYILSNIMVFSTP